MYRNREVERRLFGYKMYIDNSLQNYINKKSKKNLYLFDDISIFRRQMGRIYSMKFVKKWSGVAFEWTVFSKEILKKKRKILFFETFSLKNERKISMAFYLFICNENVNTHAIRSSLIYIIRLLPSRIFKSSKSFEIFIYKFI